MSEGDCKQCRILLGEASRVISAHLAAVSRLSEAIQADDSVILTNRLRETVRITSAAREVVIERYENHRSDHQLKVMTAGFKFPE
jgi:hypothetical protein